MILECTRMTQYLYFDDNLTEITMTEIFLKQHSYAPGSLATVNQMFEQLNRLSHVEMINKYDSRNAQLLLNRICSETRLESESWHMLGKVFSRLKIVNSRLIRENGSQKGNDILLSQSKQILRTVTASAKIVFKEIPTGHDPCSLHPNCNVKATISEKSTIEDDCTTQSRGNIQAKMERLAGQHDSRHQANGKVQTTRNMELTSEDSCKLGSNDSVEVKMNMKLTSEVGTGLILNNDNKALYDYDVMKPIDPPPVKYPEIVVFGDDVMESFRKYLIERRGIHADSIQVIHNDGRDSINTLYSDVRLLVQEDTDRVLLVIIYLPQWSLDLQVKRLCFDAVVEQIKESIRIIRTHMPRSEIVIIVSAGFCATSRNTAGRHLDEILINEYMLTSTSNYGSVTVQLINKKFAAIEDFSSDLKGVIRSIYKALSDQRMYKNLPMSRMDGDANRKCFENNRFFPWSEAHSRQRNHGTVAGFCDSAILVDALFVNEEGMAWLTKESGADDGNLMSLVNF